MRRCCLAGTDLFLFAPLCNAKDGVRQGGRRIIIEPRIHFSDLSYRLKVSTGRDLNPAARALKLQPRRPCSSNSIPAPTNAPARIDATPSPAVVGVAVFGDLVATCEAESLAGKLNGGEPGSSSWLGVWCLVSQTNDKDLYGDGRWLVGPHPRRVPAHHFCRWTIHTSSRNHVILRSR